MISKKLTKKKKTSRSKSKPKRMGTFNSSEFSLLDERNYLSACDLFKNQALKKKNNLYMTSSALSLLPKKNKSQKNLNTTKKKLKNKSKSKTKLKKPQTYEVIPIKHSLNSQIIFSNQDTKREDKDGVNSEKTIAIKFNQQYLIENKALSQNIKKLYQRKVEAAIKIQKIFRGYLTRKILQKYISNQHKILSARIQQNKSDQISQHSSYFAQKSSLNSKRRPQNYNQEMHMNSAKNKLNQNIDKSDQEANEEEDEQIQIDRIAYRHQQPIYSHQDIPYLDSSGEEQDFSEDAFNNNIIFETNQQYIQSRKSSLQNKHEPKNKLSRPNTNDHASNPHEPSQQKTENVPLQSAEPIAAAQQEQHSTLTTDLSKTQKKDKQKYKNSSKQSVNVEQIKEQTIKLIQESDNASHLPINLFMDTISYDSAFRQQHQIANFMKKDKVETVQVSKKQVSKLISLESQKWEEMISLVGSQIQKNIQNNTQMHNFMKTIMEISMKNKQMLEIKGIQSEHQVNEFMTPSDDKQESNEKSTNKRRKRKFHQELEIYEESISEKEVDSMEQSKSFEHQHQIQKINQLINQQNLSKIFQTKKQKNQKSMRINEALFFMQNDENSKNKASKSSRMVHEQSNRSNDPANPLSPLSSFENTGQIKRFLLGNIHDDNIEEMLHLRQNLLKKRQNESLKKLNLDLAQNKISQQQFLQKLEHLTKKFIEDKRAIQKARQDINKGYTAALNLTKEACYDAKRLGYKLPISRSMEGLQFKSPLIFTEVIIDQLKESKKVKNGLQKLDKKKIDEPISRIFQNDGSLSEERINIEIPSETQSSDVEFTQEELNRFRRAQPYNSMEFVEQIADLNKNMMISDDFIRQQQRNNDNFQKENTFNQTNRHKFRQIYEIQEPVPTNRSDPRVQMITEKQLQSLIWQISTQLLIKPAFSQRLIDKTHFYRPQLITKQERKLFIQILTNNFPQTEILQQKLNQKICPLPSELLKCMRIDFSEQDDEDQNSYEEVGKYEFIINQEVCNTAVNIFKERMEGQNRIEYDGIKDYEELEKEFSFNEKVSKYIIQRQRFLSNRKKHTKQLRWEVLNIEIHCIFDAWNEELIQLRGQKAGYSGIGLNELTLSIIDHNTFVKIQETASVIEEGKTKLLRTLDLIEFDPQPLNQQDQLLQSDSKWIFYADQALSFGLELVYLVQEQILSECARELRRKFILGRESLFGQNNL